MIHLTGRLICASHAQARTVMMALPEHIRLTQAEPGCLLFQVTQTSDPLIWQVEERFADAAAFAAHQTRVRKSDWGQRTQGITRDYRVAVQEKLAKQDIPTAQLAP